MTSRPKGGFNPAQRRYSKEEKKAALKKGHSRQGGQDYRIWKTLDYNSPDRWLYIDSHKERDIFAFG